MGSFILGLIIGLIVGAVITFYGILAVSKKMGREVKKRLIPKN